MSKAALLKNRFVPQVVPRAPIEGPSEARSANEDPLAILSELLGSPNKDEIVAKLRELARSARALADSQTAVSSETVEMGDLCIEKHAHRVLVSAREVSLTSLEFRLLVTLVDRRDHVQSRGTLLSDVWGHHPSSRTRTVDTHVRRLRDKLGSAGAYIHTVRGVGYRFSQRQSIRHRDGRCVPREQAEIESLAG
jgi:DNA-binding winged helix-turn-helix (wHTH) protein